MTVARSTKIDLDETPYYHCVSRCVRRTFLCGIDRQTGQDYSHRRNWIITRMKKLVGIFAIKICAYAVMNNHYHLVLFVNKSQSEQWTELEIKKRWAALFPTDAKKIEDNFLTSTEVKKKLLLWTERLTSISWFMRCMNENIARLSNIEDECTGRFWEGRFKSQALLDEGALLSAMAYVDLNPIRAKEALTLEHSEFTSIYERIKILAASQKNKEFKLNSLQLLRKKNRQNINQPVDLMVFSNGYSSKDSFAKIHFNLLDYLQLVDSTGRILREDKRGVIPEHCLPILHRLKISNTGWLDIIKNIENKFSHVIGHFQALKNFGIKKRMKAPKGYSTAKKYYLHSNAA